MNNLSLSSLTPAQLALLQLYAFEGTSNTQLLASISGRSVDTIETQFKLINRALGTSRRDEALLFAIRRGWVSVKTLPDQIG